MTTEEWMYAPDAHMLDKDDHNKGITVFACPECGLKSRVITDAHDDFICDCGYEMTLGVHNHPPETMKRMLVTRKGDDLYCVDKETGQFLGILRHSVGFYGESTGIFMRMETTSLSELGYEEIPSGYIPED